MPFFLPALGALFSDIAIVYLIYSSPPNANPFVPEEGQSDDEHGKYDLQYLHHVLGRWYAGARVGLSLGRLCCSASFFESHLLTHCEQFPGHKYMLFLFCHFSLHL